MDGLWPEGRIGRPKGDMHTPLFLFRSGQGAGALPSEIPISPGTTPIVSLSHCGGIHRRNLAR